MSTPAADMSTAVWRASILRRIKTPTLMLNSKHDFVIPLKKQQALFNLLGTPEKDKKHLVYDTGHLNFPLGQFIKDNLDWLDTYFKPATLRRQQ